MGILKNIVQLAKIIEDGASGLKEKNARELRALVRESNSLVSQFLSFDNGKLREFQVALDKADQEIRDRFNSILQPINPHQAGLLKLIHLFKFAESRRRIGDMEQIFIAIYNILDTPFSFDHNRDDTGKLIGYRNRIGPHALNDAWEVIRPFEIHMMDKGLL